MRTPKIALYGWNLGQVSNKIARVFTGGQLLKQLDNYSEEGVLKINDLVSSDKAIASVATCFEKFDDGSGNGVEEYAIAGQVIWRKRGGTWSSAHTNGQTVTAGSFQFLKAYDKAAAATTKNALYYTADGKLGVYYYDGAAEQWNDTVQTFTNADTKSHPMVTKSGYLYIGDGSYIARLEPLGASFDADALTMTEGYRALSMAVYNNRVIVGTFRGSNLYDIADAKLAVWDGITGNDEEDILNLAECGITALEEFGGYLWVFAGVKGHIYRFNGAGIKQWRTIKNVKRKVYVKPGAIGKHNGNLLFGLSDDWNDASEEALQGVYAIHESEGDFSLSLDFVESGEHTTKVQIGAIISNVDATGILFSSSYNSGSYKIDKSSANGAAKATTGTFESQAYVISPDAEGEHIEGVEILADTLPDGTSVNVYYRKAGDTAWSSSLIAITSSNQDLVHGVNTELVKIIEIKMVLTSSGGNTPRIFGLNIY